LAPESVKQFRQGIKAFLKSEEWKLIEEIINVHRTAYVLIIEDEATDDTEYHNLRAKMRALYEFGKEVYDLGVTKPEEEEKS
jgi:hypothetical protein